MIKKGVGGSRQVGRQIGRQAHSKIDRQAGCYTDAHLHED